MIEIRASNQAAMVALYGRYGHLVYEHARRIVADKSVLEEVCQDVFLTAWRHADRYDSERGTPATWLLAITRSCALDRLRTDRKFAADRVGIDESRQQQFESPPVHETVETSQRSKRVRDAIQLLTPAQAEVIQLSFFAGLSHSEIAQQTGLALGTVKSRTVGAMANLRRTLVSV